LVNPSSSFGKKNLVFFVPHSVHTASLEAPVSERVYCFKCRSSSTCCRSFQRRIFPGSHAH